MRKAKLFHAGAERWGEVLDDHVRLGDGASVSLADAQWLPPIERGATVFALGLNYADHNRELGFAATRPVPLIFLKGVSAFVGHGGETVRPADGHSMHPECELAVIIGREARNVVAADALNFVDGYTVANDYAIREYLDNYYRPNARVKNRARTTPIGPWIVDADDIADPQDLALRTTINGQTVQEGSTADMILGVADLIAYLSGILTLQPGDVILTGTPQGVAFVQPGDVVTTMIAGIGSLDNHLTGAA